MKRSHLRPTRPLEGSKLKRGLQPSAAPVGTCLLVAYVEPAPAAPWAAAPGSSLPELEELCHGYPNCVLVSAERGWGLEQLLTTIDAVLGQTMVRLKVRLPYRASHLVHLFHQRGTIISERYTSEGTIIEGSLPRQLASKFNTYAVH